MPTVTIQSSSGNESGNVPIHSGTVTFLELIVNVFNAKTKNLR